MGQVVSLNFLVQKINSVERAKYEPVVFTNGCFDILHVGHIRYLQEARSLGQTLIVGLNTDASVQRLKGDSRPIQNENDRAEILSALRCVDYVVLFHEDTPLEMIRALRPNFLVKGGDWPLHKIVGSDFVLTSGGQVRSLPFQPGHSTTGILQKIQSL